MSRIHKRILKVFVLPKGQPAGPPRMNQTLQIEADSMDGLLVVARKSLTLEGYSRVRCVSFAPEGVVAYVEEQT